MSQNKLIEVKNLKTYFYTEAGTVKAVNDVSFDIYKGEVLGIVGESGSGKSVTSLSINRLIPNPPGEIIAGEVLFNGINLLDLSYDEDLRAQADANFVICESGKIVEIQVSGEEYAFTSEQFQNIFKQLVQI